MAKEWIWVRHELPWLGPGFVHAVHDDAIDELSSELVRLGFEVWELDGRAIREHDAFFAELYPVIGLPLTWGRNWDAFDEGIRELYERVPHHVALVWRHAEDSASSSLKTFAEAISMLDEWSRSLHAAGRAQLEIFITGQSSGFQSPRGFACPCCGSLTLREEPPGTYEICPVCFWEDDPVQFNDPTYSGGANKVSLNQARENFRRLGASETRLREHVRKPLPRELPEPPAS